VTHYLWEGAQVLSEHNGGTGAVQVDYIQSGSRLLAKVAGGTTNYFLSDRLSVRLMMNASGAVVGRQSHLAYGEEFAESGNQQKQHFTNYESDSESGSDYAINRQYHPNIGRFNRVDPLASSARKEMPQTWNRYSYAVNEPVDQHDPTGLDPLAPTQDPRWWPIFLPPWELDPCAPRGASYTVDGFDTGFAALCNLGPAPAADPAPEPASATCSIKNLTRGPRRGNYPKWDWTTSPLPKNQRHGKFMSPDNNLMWWRFFYETMVTISGPFDPSEWESGFKREVWIEGSFITRDSSGNLQLVPVSRQDAHDLSDPTQQTWIGNTSYWLDAPGRPTINAKGNGDPIIEGDITWIFIMSATSSRTGNTCSARLELKLHISTPAGPGPPFPETQADWEVK
jgi:RHS repeat-associated protein